MTGIGMAAASGATPSGPPPITGFTIGWSAAKDQFVLNNSPGTMAGNATTSITGGTGPFTYLYFWVSSHTGLTINNPNVQAATVNYDALTTTGQQWVGHLDCIVTDANGQHRTASTDMGGQLDLTMTRG